MSYFNFFAAAVASATLALPAGACSCSDFTPTPTPTLTAVTTGVQTTKAFAGLNWAFGAGGTKPEAILGVSFGDTSTTNSLKGARLALHFGVDAADGINLKKVKLTRLWGDIYKQGEFGLGYNFATGTPFGISGVNVGNISFGADVGFDGGFFAGRSDIDGYVGVQSIGTYDEATTTWIDLDG